MGGNVPLNNTLDGFDLESATSAALADQRGGYESAWNRWHRLRTLASVAAMAAAVAAPLIDAGSEA